MANFERSKLDVMLDLLVDEVAQRLAERREPDPPAPALSLPITLPALAASPAPDPMPEPDLDLTIDPAREQESAPAMDLWAEPEPAVVAAAPSHAAALIARLALGLLFVVTLINIPFNTEGVAIARSIPNSASLVIRDGLLVKESNSPDVWVYRDGAFHWITSLDAFEHFRYRWQDVHVVEPGFLNTFGKGAPLYMLLKCDGSPHVYRLEAGSKRWIVDIATFQAEGYIWKDIKMVPCGYLRGLPDGDSLPPGRGSPPS